MLVRSVGFLVVCFSLSLSLSLSLALSPISSSSSRRQTVVYQRANYKFAGTKRKICFRCVVVRMVLLGEIFPNFKAPTTVGILDFHEWLDNSWAILFSHPHDFTPICTTELAKVVKLMPEFTRLGVKTIAISCNSLDSHIKWIEDIKSYAGVSTAGFPYPIIEDESRAIATKLGMLDPDELDKDGVPLAARAVFVIDPLKKMRLSILYPATTGRNFDEIIRAIESLRLTDSYRVATPVDWKKGDDVMVHPALTTEEAQKNFDGNVKTVSVPSGKQYMRFVPHPAAALSNK